MKRDLEHREFWLQCLERIALPLYSQLAKGQLKATMPVAEARKDVAHLEALGRSLAGIAPWLQCGGLAPEEKMRQDILIDLVKASLDKASDPGSPDFVNFSGKGQPLVDAAFLAQGLLRSEKTVWNTLDSRVKKNLVAALRQTHHIRPPFNNWLLFAAMVEAFFCHVGEDYDPIRVDYALRQHEQWYVGDGNYKDGPTHHWDYYNSFVIQPMLLEVLDCVSHRDEVWKSFIPRMTARARRYAAVQERMIGTDGTFPPLGRSLTYRSGSFQHLALMALRNELPEEIKAPQVRCAMTAMMERTLMAPGTFDKEGWLTIGLAGFQPSMAECYISTGSVYLCACSLLPLGLEPAHPFWLGADEAWTSQKVWSGQDHPADHALNDSLHV